MKFRMHVEVDDEWYHL